MPGIPVYYSDELRQFDFGPGHPFTGTRFSEFIGLLEKAGLLKHCELLEPVPATDDDLGLVHTGEYLALVKKAMDIGGWLSMDTPATRGAVNAQRYIAGSGLQAAKLLLEDERNIAHTFGGFHHAGAGYGEGFCIYNDVAIAARALTERHGLDRVMVLDSDAHQGNGTMDIFYRDPKVLFVSIHQDPKTIYPGKGFVWETGEDEGAGFTVNIPMPPFSGAKQYSMAFEEIIEPLAREFKPQMFIRNGGSDPFYGDELTMLGLDLDGLAMVSRRTRELALGTAGKLIDMTCSGYGEWVKYGWLAQFCGCEALDADYNAQSPKPPRRSPSCTEDSITRAAGSMLDTLKREVGKYWKLF
ncbi:MAG: acetoin utilization protein AcuC [Thermoplasmata archaeon]